MHASDSLLILERNDEENWLFSKATTKLNARATIPLEETGRLHFWMTYDHNSTDDDLV